MAGNGGSFEVFVSAFFLVVVLLLKQTQPGIVTAGLHGKVAHSWYGLLGLVQGRRVQNDKAESSHRGDGKDPKKEPVQDEGNVLPVLNDLQEEKACGGHSIRVRKEQSLTPLAIQKLAAKNVTHPHEHFPDENFQN